MGNRITDLTQGREDAGAATRRSRNRMREAFGVRPGLPAFSSNPRRTKAGASSTHSPNASRGRSRLQNPRGLLATGWAIEVQRREEGEGCRSSGQKKPKVLPFLVRFLTGFGGLVLR